MPAVTRALGRGAQERTVTPLRTAGYFVNESVNATFVMPYDRGMVLKRQHRRLGRRSESEG